MANIAVTAKAAKEYGELARKAHPKLDASICAERTAWNHDNKTEVEVSIWCSICGEHYTSLEAFNKEHTDTISSGRGE